ncbi:hypothetical protein [Nocardia sp. NPDC052566]|uniref:hypothetical protein n=1 Tax=Nocardia sp. NPDC052566 TaxID=3364330 RepID=UPI0037C71D69
MIENIIAPVVVALLYPFLLFGRLAARLAKKLRIEVFDAAVSLLIVLPWLDSFLTSFFALREGRYPVGDLVLVTLGAIYLLHVAAMSLRGFSAARRSRAEADQQPTD